MTLDTGSGMEKVGSGIKTPDPQHCRTRTRTNELQEGVVLLLLIRIRDPGIWTLDPGWKNLDPG
jgi:hypothetical protein